MSEAKIRVVARIRPPIKKELIAAERVSTTRLDDYTTLRVAGSTADDLEEVRQAHFRFDAVYNEDDDQTTIYEEEVAELVDGAVLQGQPGTVIAYGQTGSGKSHTILGRAGHRNERTGSIDLHADSGVFLRVFCDLFRSPGIKHVTLSAVELYLDDVFDLLDGRTKKKLRDAGTEVVVQGMSEANVSSLEEVLQVFEIANAARSVSSTSMNDASSRSHAVFFIGIPADPERGRPNPTRLLLVDLAGSERIKKSKVEGGAVAEAAAINSSLSTLGTVVHAMYVNSAHVPYRDSKLTGVLKSTFANKGCKVLLIGQFSPVSSNALESISSAKFCDRVKGLAVNNSAFAADGGSGAATEEEKAAFVTMQQNAELASELRIARAVVGLHACGSGRKSFKPRAVMEQQARERRAIRFEIPAASGGDGGMDSEGNSSPLAQQLRAEIQAEIQAAEQLEAKEAIRRCEALKQQLLQAHMAKRLTLKTDLSSWRQKLGCVQHALSQSAAGLEAEVAAKTTEAKRAKKRRVQLDERMLELRAQDAVVTKHLLETPENYVLPPSQVDFDADDDVEAQAAQQRQEATHAIIAVFYQHWRVLGRCHGDVVTCERRSVAAEQEMLDFRRTGNATSIHSLQFASDIVAFAWRRAFDIATRAISEDEPWAWSDVVGCSGILCDAPHWVPNPLKLVPEFAKQPVDDEAMINATFIPPEDDYISPATTAAAAAAKKKEPSTKRAIVLDPISDDEDQVPDFEVGAGSKTAAASNNNNSNNSKQSASSSGAGADAGKENSNGGGESTSTASKAEEQQRKIVRRKKTPEELALAEKHYLMSIYDSKTLVADIAKFLESGTKVMKHGRAGDPHQKHARVRNGFLYWFDVTAKTEAEQVKSCIPMSGIGSIVLGPHSRVFRRNPIEPSHPDYFLSFTLNLKDGSRSLDLVADNLVDFEAWVIGAVNMCQVDAHWGRPLNCAALEPAEYAQLTPFEKALCDKENLLPSVYSKVRAKVIEQRNDIAMHMRAFRGDKAAAFHTMGGGIHMPSMGENGAVLITKGELRYHCSPFNVCIFRVCKLFEFFKDQGLIYDPEYTPICKFGK